MTMTGRPRPAAINMLPGPADYQRVEASLGREKAGFTIQRRCAGEVWGGGDPLGREKAGFTIQRRWAGGGGDLPFRNNPACKIMQGGRE